MIVFLISAVAFLVIINDKSCIIFHCEYLHLLKLILFYPVLVLLVVHKIRFIMSHQGEEEKHTLLGDGSESDLDRHEYQGVRNHFFSKARTYKTFLYLTTTLSVLAILILLPKYHVLRANHTRLEKELIKLKNHTAMFEDHVHMEKSLYG